MRTGGNWSTRELATLPEEERERFLTGGVKLCSRKQDMVTFNEAGLRRTGNPILMLKALHNNSTARNASESKGQFPALLPVAPRWCSPPIFGPRRNSSMGDAAPSLTSCTRRARDPRTACPPSWS